MKQFPKEHIKYLKSLQEIVDGIEEEKFKAIVKLEDEAKRHTGIDIEIFYCDGSFVGIGDYPKHYKLLQCE